MTIGLMSWKVDRDLIVYLRDVRGHASFLRSRPLSSKTMGHKARPIGAACIGAIMNHPRDWLQPKIVGIGWSPRTWEGWAIIASVIVIGTIVGRVNL